MKQRLINVPLISPGIRKRRRSRIARQVVQPQATPRGQAHALHLYLRLHRGEPRHLAAGTCLYYSVSMIVLTIFSQQFNVTHGISRYS